MKETILSGSLSNIDTQEIYLNVSSLKKGVYQLKIIDNNSIVRNTHFIKK